MNSKKFAMFLLLAGGGLLIFSLLNKGSDKKDAPTDDPKENQQIQQETVEKKVSDATPPSPAEITAAKLQAKDPSNPTTWKVKDGTPETSRMGSLAPKNYKNPDGYKLQLIIDPRGAAVRTARLTDFFQTVKDKQLYHRDPDNYGKTVAKNPKKIKGHYTVLRPVEGKDKEYLSYGTEKYKVTCGTYSQEFVPGAENWRKTKAATNDTQSSVTYELYYGYQSPDKWISTFTLQKTFTLAKGSYSVDVSLKLINHLDKEIKLEIEQAGPTGVAREGYREDERTLAMAVVKDGEVEPILRAVKVLKEAKIGENSPLGKSDATDQSVMWYGFVNKFFGSISYVKPLLSDQLSAASYNIEYFGKAIDADVAASAEDLKRTWDTSIKITEIILAPVNEKNSQMTINMDIFIGPKDRRLFLDNPLYSKLEYVDTVASGSCGFLAWDWLRNGLMWLLTFFATKLFFGNYGLAIILLVLVVRVILHPLTKKGQISMANMQKNMAKLQPKISKLKEKYANDKQALSAETMKLYKEHGNPMTGMLGCLPMMLQMPIWVALFSGLNTSVNLRNAGLLPFWLTDLAAPDQLITWADSIPLIGNSFNLLPILLCVAMYLQTKMNPSMNSATATPEQAQQQKMMKYMMPIMMLFFFYKAPSGLTLYIMASTGIGVVEQMVIRKHIRERDELAAATETVVDVSGGGMRGSRQKKPKGPGWQKR
ncbi:MAG: membrane protein insertase YidC [Phycisphaerae bacterium]|nr:membrane protein insertase YidC [Phycisphaerae bacterium]